MTGKGFLDKVLRGGLVNAFGQTGGLTGLGPKFSYDAKKGFVGSNPLVGGYASQVAGGDFGQQMQEFRELVPQIREQLTQSRVDHDIFNPKELVNEKGVLIRKTLPGGLFGNFSK